MSLESNISAKAREKFNNRDLFEHLTYDDPYGEREEGSLRNRHRLTEGAGMAEEGAWRGEQKMSVEG